MEKQRQARNNEPYSGRDFNNPETYGRSFGLSSSQEAEGVAYTFNLVPNFRLLSPPIVESSGSTNEHHDINYSAFNMQAKEKPAANTGPRVQDHTQTHIDDLNCSSNPVYPCAVFANNGSGTPTMLNVTNYVGKISKDCSTSMLKGRVNENLISTKGTNASKEVVSAIGTSKERSGNSSFQKTTLQRLLFSPPLGGQSHALKTTTIVSTSVPRNACKSINSTQSLNGSGHSHTWHKQCNSFSTTTSIANKEMKLKSFPNMNSSNKIPSPVTHCTNHAVTAENLPFAPQSTQVSNVNKSTILNVHNQHMSKTSTCFSRHRSPTTLSTYTNDSTTKEKSSVDKGTVIDVETEDIEDCMLVSIDLSKQMSSIGSKIHNLQVVIDSDDDEPVTSTEKNDSVSSTQNNDSCQVQQSHGNKRECVVSVDNSKTHGLKRSPQNNSDQQQQIVQDKDIEVYIDKDIKEESLDIDPGVHLWQSTNLESANPKLQASNEADLLKESTNQLRSSLTTGESDRISIARLNFAQTLNKELKESKNQLKSSSTTGESDRISIARSNFAKTLNKEAQRNKLLDMSTPEPTSTTKKLKQSPKVNKSSPPKKADPPVCTTLNTGGKTQTLYEKLKIANKLSSSTAADSMYSSDRNAPNNEENRAEQAVVAQSISIASSHQRHISNIDTVESTVEIEVKKELPEGSNINSFRSDPAEQINTELENSSETVNMNYKNNSANSDTQRGNSSQKSFQVKKGFDLEASESALKCLKCKRTFLSTHQYHLHLISSSSCKAYTDKLLSQHKPKDKDVLCCVSCHHTSNNIDNKFQHVALNSACFQKYASLCISCNAEVHFASENERFEQTRACRKTQLLPSFEANKSEDEIRKKQNTGLLLMSAGVATLSSVNPPTSCTVRCEGCSSWFSSYARFKLHVHGNSSCKDFYDNRYSLKRDFNSSLSKKERPTNKPNILCPVCSKKFATNAMLTIHLNENTTCRSKFLKSSAPKIAKRGGNYERKKIDTNVHDAGFHTSDKELSRTSYNTDSHNATKFNLKKIVIKLSPKSVMCSSCHEPFRDDDVLSKHLSSTPSCNEQSNSEELFQCSGCKKNFKGDESLAKHIQKSYLCQAKIDSQNTPGNSNTVETSSISRELNRGQKKPSPKVQQQIPFLNVEVNERQLNKTLPEVLRSCKGCKRHFRGDEGLAKHIQNSYLCQVKMDSISTAGTLETSSISRELNKGQRKPPAKVRQEVFVHNVDVDESQLNKTLPEVIRSHESLLIQEMTTSTPQPSFSVIERDELDEIADEFSSQESEGDGSSSTSSDEADVEYRCKTCNKVFTQKLLFKQHMKQHRRDPGQTTGRCLQKLKCGSCRKKMKSQKDYQAHLLKKSFCFLKVTKRLWYKKPGDTLACKMCNKVLKSVHDLGKHCFKNMTCRLCYVDAVLNFNSTSVTSTSDGDSHEAFAEDPKSTDHVSSSGQSVESPIQQTVHQPRQDGHLSFECEHCQVTFDSAFHFQLHFFNDKPDCLDHYAKLGPGLQEQVPYCFRCKSRFINTQKLRTHKCIGFRRYVRVCSHCNFKFPSLISLEAHAQNNENCAKALDMQSQLKCISLEKEPNKVARKSTSSKREQQSHTSHTKICTKSPKCQNHLDDSHPLASNADKNVHTSPCKTSKEFSCRICFRKFPVISSLLEHSYEHTEEKHYDCKRCGFMCYRYNRLVSHEAVHDRLDKECAHFDDRLDLHSVVVPDSCNSDDETIASNGDGNTQDKKNKTQKYVCHGCGINFETFKGLRKHQSCSKRCKVRGQSIERKERKNIKEENPPLAVTQTKNHKESMPTIRPSIKIVSKIGSSGKRFLTATPVKQVPREDHLYCFACHCFLKSEEDVGRHAVHKRHALLSRRIFRRAVWFPGQYFCKICKVHMTQKSSLVAHMVRKHNQGTSSLLKVLTSIDNGSLQTSAINQSPAPATIQNPAPCRLGRTFCILCKSLIANNKKKHHFMVHMKDLISEIRSSSALPLLHPSRETCKICRLKFVSRRGLLTHLGRHREEDIFSSHSQLGKFKARHSFQLPCLTKGGQRLKPRSTPGRCKLCQKNFLSISVFKGHFKLSHSNRYSKPALLYYVRISNDSSNKSQTTARDSILPPKIKEPQQVTQNSTEKCHPERKDNFAAHCVKGKKLAHNMHWWRKNNYYCKICKWSHRKRERVTSHIRRRHGNYLPSSIQSLYVKNGLNICKICNASFESSKGFKNHFTLIHEEKNLMNSLCLYGSATISLDAEPGFSFQKKRVLCCRLCNSKVKAVLYGKHLMMRHNWLKGNLHPCQYCNVDFPNKEDLYNHMLQCERDCCCRLCGKQLNSPHGIRNHVILSHQRPWDKYVREMIYLDKRSFDKERTVELSHDINLDCVQKEASLKCSVCENIFEETDKYLEHMKTHLIPCNVNLGNKAEVLHKDLEKEDFVMADSCTNYESKATSTAYGSNMPDVSLNLCHANSLDLLSKEVASDHIEIETVSNEEECTSSFEQQDEIDILIGKEMSITANKTNTCTTESSFMKSRDSCLQEKQEQMSETNSEPSMLALREIGLDCFISNAVHQINEAKKISLQDHLAYGSPTKKNYPIGISMTKNNPSMGISKKTISVVCESSPSCSSEHSNGHADIAKKQKHSDVSSNDIGLDFAIHESIKDMTNEHCLHGQSVYDKPKVYDTSVPDNSSENDSPQSIVNNTPRQGASESHTSHEDGPSEKDQARAITEHNQLLDLEQVHEENEETCRDKVSEKLDNLNPHIQMSRSYKRKTLNTNWGEQGLTTEKRRNTENNAAVGGIIYSEQTLEIKDIGSVGKAGLQNSTLNGSQASNPASAKSSISSNASKLSSVEGDVTLMGSQITKYSVQDCAFSARESSEVCSLNQGMLVNIKTEKPDSYVYSESRNLFTVLNDSVNLIDDENGDLLFVAYDHPTLEDFVKPRSPISSAQNIPKIPVFNNKNSSPASVNPLCKVISEASNSDPVSSSSGFSDTCNGRNVFDMLKE